MPRAYPRRQVVAPLAHVGSGVFEPLQLLPPFAALLAYALRARSLARGGRAVPPARIASFAAGIALIVAGLTTPVAHLGGELVLAHMGQHLLIADLGALFVVLGLTGPLLQPLLATRLARSLAYSPIRWWLLPLGGRSVRVAPARALRGIAELAGGSRAAAHDVRLLRGDDVVRATRPAAPAGVVRQRRGAPLRRRRSAHRRAARQRLRLVGERVLSRLPPRPGRVGHHAAGGPGDRGDAHDAGGEHRDGGAPRLALPQGGPGERRAPGARGARPRPRGGGQRAPRRSGGGGGPGDELRRRLEATADSVPREPAGV